MRTPFKNRDVADQKAVGVAGEKSLTFRAELINAFDDPNFRGPATVFGRADFGRVSEVGGFPRLVHLTARFAF